MAETSVGTSIARPQKASILRSARIKGADLSSLLEVEENGGKFYDCSGTQCAPSASISDSCRPERSAAESKDPHLPSPEGTRTDAPSCSGVQCAPQDVLTILRRHGVNLIRLRLWNDPYSETGEAYGAGTNDLLRTAALARRCKALGLDWLLDFHYSDFWADPGKQFLPKAWANYNTDQLEQAVYDFTYETLTALKAADLLPAIIAPGNELSNGLLWPFGKVPNWDGIARLVSAGIRAIREAAPQSAVMLHLDNGGNCVLYETWFREYLAHGGADFDCIGLSYYPFWHGTLPMLGHTMETMAQQYGKPMIVAETSMAFTLEECCAREGLRRDQKRGLAVTPTLAEKVPYPVTPEGQSAFLRDLWKVICAAPGDLGRGLIWWEPAWIPVPGAEWTKPAGLRYIQERGPGGNEWANQCLFDYDGNTLPAMAALRSLE